MDQRHTDQTTRVLYWMPFAWPHIGGVEKIAGHLIPELSRRGYAFRVVAGHHSENTPDNELLDGIPVHRFSFFDAFRTRDPAVFARTRKRIAQLKRTFQPDIVHVTFNDPSLLFHLQTPASPEPSLLLTLQVALPDREFTEETLTRRALLAADWISCVSRVVLDDTTRRVPAIASRSSIIYNFVEPPPEAPSPLPWSPPRVLCLGRIVPQKGFDLAVDAFRVIHARVPDARLILAGDGPEKIPLQEKVKALGLSPWVDFTGWVKPSDVYPVIGSATVLLMPSRFEGLPLVALEASLMARPVIATRVDGISEVVEDGATGILVEPEDSRALADAAIRVLNNPSLARRLGASARRRTQSRFSPAQCIDAYDRLYRQLAGAKRGPRDVGGSGRFARR